MIKTAVILAAGKGNRLNKITNYKSKPLTEPLENISFINPEPRSLKVFSLYSLRIYPSKIINENNTYYN